MIFVSGFAAKRSVGDFGAGGGQYSAWLNDTGLVEVVPVDLVAITWQLINGDFTLNFGQLRKGQFWTPHHPSSAANWKALAFDNTMAVKDITGGAVQEAGGGFLLQTDLQISMKFQGSTQHLETKRLFCWTGRSDEARTRFAKDI